MAFHSRKPFHVYFAAQDAHANHVIVSPERYEQMLEALEEIADVAAFHEAMTEEGPNIPWVQVKADLGWV